MADPIVIKLLENAVCVHRFGRGSRLLIAFHGFKESGDLFKEFEPLWGDEYTIYAPDLPFHGLTRWAAPWCLPGHLEELIRLMLAEFGTPSFSMLGYSLGGKIALSLVEPFIPRLEQLILLAPDGLKENFWYNFVTRTRTGHLLFSYLTRHSFLFHTLVNIGFKLRLINESVYRFVHHHTIDLKGRQLVYQLWNSMKYVRPNQDQISTCIRQHSLAVQLFFGRFDRIFPVSLGNSWKTLPSVEIHVIDSGHRMLHAGMMETIYACLCKTKPAS